MHRTRTIAFFLATTVTAIAVLATTEAHAVQRTHVSAVIGDDANTATGCTPVAPCRTFQAAMGVTDVNGEVVVLDSGGYGEVVVNQSVSLIAPPGVFGGIAVFPNKSGVIISTPGINVVLRGLTINGQGGNDGITVVSKDNKVTVENCVISNLKQAGIRVNGGTTLRVTNTIIRDNASIGVVLQDGARATITRSTISGHGGTGVVAFALFDNATTSADIADSTLNGNNIGISGSSLIANAVIKISVRDSRVTHSASFGMVAESSKGGAVNLSASNNIVSNNGNGMGASNAGAKIWASGNTVSDNITGFKNDGGAFASDGNNAVRNNGTNTQGTIIPVSTK
jgi:Right handed beta helix region